MVDEGLMSVVRFEGCLEVRRSVVSLEDARKPANQE
jgi:hypothetical protein